MYRKRSDDYDRLDDLETECARLDRETDMQWAEIEALKSTRRRLRTLAALAIPAVLLALGIVQAARYQPKPKRCVDGLHSETCEHVQHSLELTELEDRNGTPLVLCRCRGVGGGGQ